MKQINTGEDFKAFYQVQQVQVYIEICWTGKGLMRANKGAIATSQGIIKAGQDI